VSVRASSNNFGAADLSFRAANARINSTCALRFAVTSCATMASPTGPRRSSVNACRAALCSASSLEVAASASSGIARLIAQRSQSGKGGETHLEIRTARRDENRRRRRHVTALLQHSEQAICIAGVTFVASW